MIVVPLRSRPEFIPQLAEWHDQQWQHLYSVSYPQMAIRQFRSEPSDGRLPQTLLAMDGERLLGSISLLFNDLPCWEHLNPWVASFLVIAEARGRGIGRQLLAAGEDLLRSQKISLAYLFTETAQRFFEKHGWQAFEQAETNGYAITIMTKRLADCNLPPSPSE